MKKQGLLIAAALAGLIHCGIVLAEDQTPASVSVSPPAEQVSIPPLDIVQIKSGKRVLNIGHYNQLPPFYFANDNTHPGFGHDILVAVAKKAGIHNIHFIGFDSTADLNTELREGRIDMIANAWDLPGMRKQFLLTDPYYKGGGLGFLYRQKAGAFQNPDDLRYHSVGTFEHGYAQNYWLPAHDINQYLVKTYSNADDMVKALQEGRIDVAVVYYPLAQ